MDDQETMNDQGDDAGQAAPPDSYEADEVQAATGDVEAAPESGKPDNRNTWIIIGAIVAAVVVVTCCIFFAILGVLLIREDGGSQPEPTMAPIPTQGVQPTQSAPDIAPVAVINYQPAEAAVGEEVMFDGSQSTPGSTSIASYEWDFGDGSQASGAVVSHPYANPGTYGATLIVTGEDGLSNQAAPVQVTIHDQAPPVPTEGPVPTNTPLPTGVPPQPTEVPPQPDTPVPEPTLPPPVISAFRVAPQEVSAGGCVNLAWRAGGGTSWVNIVRNDDFIWENAPLDGTIQDCPDTAGEYLYKIVAYNPADDHVREEMTVTVSE